MALKTEVLNQDWNRTLKVSICSDMLAKASSLRPHLTFNEHVLGSRGKPRELVQKKLLRHIILL